MRLVAIMPRSEQVGFLVDSLRNAGFDRKDMVITDLAEGREHDTRAGEKLAYIQTERDELFAKEPWAKKFVESYHGPGIAVAVECPKHETARVRGIMEQSGAKKILDA